MRSGLLELFFQAFPSDVEGFGEDSGFAYDGQEIGVGHPAGQDVHVDVSGDAGTSGLADIHAQIDSVGMVNLAKNTFHFLG